MNVAISESWKSILSKEFEKSYFSQLMRFVRSEYKHHTCYPVENEIFAAFEHCSFEDVKVVILGQDPYHGAGQANGLCFSVNKSMSHPPSLMNIYKELEQDIGKPYPISGDLVNWSDYVVVNDSHGVVGSECTVPVSIAEMSEGLFLRLKVEN